MFLTIETLQAICRTFLHSIWQGMIAAALAGIILWATRRSSARTRYNLLGSLLLLTLLATCITFYTELRPTAAAIADITGTDIVAASVVLPSYPGEQVINYINTHADWLMLIWAVIFLLKCFRLAGGFYHIYRIRRVHVQPVPAAWEDTLKRLSHSLKIRKAVQLLESGIAKTPLTIGFFKPVIFLPLGLLAQLPADQLETILLHELAHIRRRDYFLNVLQNFAEIIFFFNPAFLWISARLREEREACCDDIVVAHTPHKATYVQALVAFEEQAALGSSLQIGLGSTRNHLLHRVKRMLTRENKKLNLMEKISLTFGLIAITAFSFMPEKEIVKPAPVNPHSVESSAYCAPPQVDTIAANKDKWVSKPARSKDKWTTSKKAKTDKKTTAEKAKEDKWVSKSVDKWATAEKATEDKWATATDTVQFPKPSHKKKLSASAGTVQFPEPVLKKKKHTTTDTVQFPKPRLKKEKISAQIVTEENNLTTYKQLLEADSERGIEKMKVFAMTGKKGPGKPSTKKSQSPLKPADKDIKKKSEATQQQGSKFFDEYLPESLRQKKASPSGKDNC
ncbi:M48 family metalloprotease [Chitinophaga sp. SYP-B3965]|uniref:M56 family metallopeptidase n=1 Tax=Chitinophaga sp. SYP-B3965 TaxID=2663120 RepID=UPI001299A341|nr:M56 family metallopeptidase [Chitinophaga sp. SYP-B3965]MRG48279.1 M48 family metalloprotease [Chitinophaga sp. SYP-B3965]